MKGLVLGLSVLLIVTCDATVAAQGQIKTIREKRVTIQMADSPLQCAIEWLVNEYDVAFGYEESTYDAKHDDFVFYHSTWLQADWKKHRLDTVSAKCFPRWPTKGHDLTLNFADAKLEDVLDELVRQMGDYRWEINDEVVNIIPVKGREPIFAELLDLKIGKFKFDAGTDLKVFGGAFSFKVPEINDFFEKKNQIPSGDSTTSSSGESTAGFDFSNIPFRELLNKITKVKRGCWSIRRDKYSTPVEQRERMIMIEL
ncbi:MAG: hypothetical protein IPN69_13085 [Acidobacteria bacterium]|nr:hypothetical protein [Acidobacteriota bacterium]